MQHSSSFVGWIICFGIPVAVVIAFIKLTCSMTKQEKSRVARSYGRFNFWTFRRWF